EVDALNDIMSFLRPTIQSSAWSPRARPLVANARYEVRRPVDRVHRPSARGTQARHPTPSVTYSTAGEDTERIVVASTGPMNEPPIRAELMTPMAPPLPCCAVRATTSGKIGAANRTWKKRTAEYPHALRGSAMAPIRSPEST